MLSEVENPVFIENTSTSIKIEMAFLCSFIGMKQQSWLLPSLATLEKPFVFIVCAFLSYQ